MDHAATTPPALKIDKGKFAMLDDIFSSLKERPMLKLELDMGPVILAAMNDSKTVEVMCKRRPHVAGTAG
jgi:hypothetical protein